MCLWCGYQVTGPVQEADADAQKSKDSPSASAEGAPEDLPEWRQELSQRLHSIKEKRTSGNPEQEAAVTPAPSDSMGTEPAQPAAPIPPPPDEKAADVAGSQKRIDEAFSRQSRQSDVLFKSYPGSNQQPKAADFNKSPMMLLARTIAGLVDLAIVGISAAILIMAADVFSGISILGFGSIVNYSMLFLLIYFVYSLFFFRISGQTIGMMLTHLRVGTGMAMERPGVGRILIRCVGYLISLFFFGLGLLWAFFDPEHRCFHDRLTDTRVVRI